MRLWKLTGAAALMAVCGMCTPVLAQDGKEPPEFKPFAEVAKDYTQVQGLVLLFATVLVAINLVVDLSYAWIDPRIRYS